MYLNETISNTKKREKGNQIKTNPKNTQKEQKLMCN